MWDGETPVQFLIITITLALVATMCHNDYTDSKIPKYASLNR